MPVLMELIGLLLAIVFLYERLRRNGFRNPFSASSRIRRKMRLNPLYALDDPRDIITALLTSLIKSTGEITGEQKQLVLRSLRKQFMLSEEEAGHYFAQSSFLMRDTVDILADADKILAPLAGKCTPAQIASVHHMLDDVATEEGKATPNTYQKALTSKVMRVLDPPPPAI